MCLSLAVIGCEQEKPWPDPPEVPEELVFEVFPEEVNVVSDNDFSETDLSKDLVTSVPVIYNEWGIVNTIPDNTSIVIKDVEGEQGEVLSIENGANGISSGSYQQAYVGQRILAKAKPAMYQLTFKARTTSVEKGSLRTFVLATGENGAIVKNFFVIHHNQDNPYEATPSDKEYTMFCTHKPLDGEWKDYTVYVNMGRTTDITAKAKFGDTKSPSDEDLKAFVVCFSSSVANTEIQIDDVEFSLLKNKEPEKPIETPEAGINIIADSDFEKADLSKDVTSISPIVFGEWGVKNIAPGMEFSVVSDDAQGKVIEITVGETSVGSANLLNAFVGQRIYAKAAPEMYKLTYKARSVSGKGTLRIFVPVTDSDGVVQKKFFAVHYNNDDPYAVTPDTQKYTIFCRHVQLTEEWGEYTCYFNMGRTTDKTTSTTFGTTVSSTDVDLEKFLICFSSSVAETVIQLDDIDFSRLGPKTE